MMLNVNMKDLKNSRTLFVLVDTCLRVTRRLLRHVTIPERHFMRIGDRDGTFKSRRLWLFAARSGLLPFPALLLPDKLSSNPEECLKGFRFYGIPRRCFVRVVGLRHWFVVFHMGLCAKFPETPWSLPLIDMKRDQPGVLPAIHPPLP
jgi:hypothetical protein